MQDETVDRDPIDVLAEEFVDRHRCGMGPTIEQYAQEHAEFAEEIRELFPAIVDIERLKQQQERAKRPLASVGGVETDRIGDFHIIREIGRGGMGVVYEAEQQSLKRRVALKVLGQNVAGTERHLQRFRREAEAAARLHHTNIVPIYGTGDVAGIHFYAMQLIHGVGLDEVIGALRRAASAESRPEIKSDTQVGSTVNEQPVAAVAHRAAQRLREGAFSRDKRPSSSAAETLSDSSDPLSAEPSYQESEQPLTLPTGRLDHRYWRTVARIARDVAQAMDYAHRHGVLHRDIKPSNLLLDHEGIVWVADFGLAKHEDSDALTKTGDIVGTLRYMAPEQFHDQVTNCSDVYSLGLTLYEMLTLNPMFGDSKQGPLLKNKTHGTFVLPRSINSQIPADLETITLKASATQPAHRYRSAAEMAEDLDRYLSERPILARPVSTGERLWRWCRRNPAVASLGSLAIMLLMSIAVILGWANYRTGLALETAEGQRKRAVNAANEAMREGTRAEGNLQLALVAFEGIMHNLASRGVPDSLEVDLGDGEVFYDVVVTNADAALLQTLLSFYDQFASQNETDLQLETATAYVRIGDIYQRLGTLGKASDAYRAALNVYDRLLESEPERDELVLAKVEALNELAISLGRGGELDKATQHHRDAEGLLKGRPALLETSAGKFELARTLNLLGSRAFRAGEDRMIGALNRSRPSPEGVWGKGRGGPGGFPGRFAPPTPRPQRGPLVNMPDSLAARQLLEELVRDEPENMDYRLALAQCFQNEIRYHRFHGRRSDAENTLQEAVQFLEQATQEFPNVPAFQYSLADTLSLVLPDSRNREVDQSHQQRVEQAIGIASQLATTYPNVPEYQSLQGRLQSDLAAAQVEAQQLEEAEKNYQAAIEQQRSLVSRYESVSLYRLSYAQSLYELAGLQRRRGQPEKARENLQEAASQVEPFTRSDQQTRRLYQRFLQQVYQRLAATHRELGDTELAAEFGRQADAIADRGRPPGMGRFRFRPGGMNRRGWRALGD